MRDVVLWSILGLWTALAVPLLCGAQGTAVLAYQHGTAIHIVAEDGRILRAIALKSPIGDWSLSPDLNDLAYVTVGEEGGMLHLLNTATGDDKQVSAKKCSKPTNASSRHCNVYANPSFSSSGRWIVVAIHSDPVDDSRPGRIAIYDRTANEFRVIQERSGDGEGPPDFAYDPKFSPDESRLLINYRSEFHVMDVSTHAEIDLLGGEAWDDAADEGKDLGVVEAVGRSWIGSHCIAYQAFNDDHKPNPIQLFNTKTQRRVAIGSMVSDEDQPTAIRLSDGVVVTLAKDQILTVQGTRSAYFKPFHIPFTERLQLLRLSPEGAPPECR